MKICIVGLTACSYGSGDQVSVFSLWLVGLGCWIHELVGRIGSGRIIDPCPNVTVHVHTSPFSVVIPQIHKPFRLYSVPLLCATIENGSGSLFRWTLFRSLEGNVTAIFQNRLNLTPNPNP